MPAQAGIQYSETSVIESKTRGVLDPPVKPGDDGGGWSIVIVVIAMTVFHEPTHVVPASAPGPIRRVVGVHRSVSDPLLNCCATTIDARGYGSRLKAGTTKVTA
jgi:hypothetical protein